MLILLHMQLKSELLNVYNKTKGYVPQKVPQGLTEFNNLINFLISTYNPAMDERSVKFTVAALLMRLDPTQAYKAPVFFARSLQRGAAAQVGSYVMEQIKQEQRAEIEALSKPPATATETVTNEQQPIQNSQV